jgi:lipopolysaccharide/colanic/teichoic acid biosynthesis glycosyltransferase
MALRSKVEDLAGMPAITLQGSPLYGWKAVLKRALDIGVSLATLAILSPLMGMIALLIKLSSRGPILERQRRMGLDCRPFMRLNFRTRRTRVDAEGAPDWTRRKTPQHTWIGALIRRTSLDELPQLVNVLKGEMSLVGLRPEPPEFMEALRARLPRAVLQHKIWAGMTGWAQVHGSRGDSSIDERLCYDLEYVRQ